MTSLRTFQAEIDNIHDRELAKQRAQAIAEREREKESKKVAPKAQENGHGNGVSDVAEDVSARGLQEIEDGVIVSCGDALSESVLLTDLLIT